MAKTQEFSGNCAVFTPEYVDSNNTNPEKPVHYNPNKKDDIGPARNQTVKNPGRTQRPVQNFNNHNRADWPTTRII